MLICAGFVAGCVPIPYPHKAYHHSNISGRVVDRESKEPIENITVRIADVEKHTGVDGLFEFIPEAKQHYFNRVPLLPFEFWWLCGDHLQFFDRDAGRTNRGMRYRDMTMKVDSCPYPAFGAMTREENLRKFKRLGNVELVRER